MTDKLHKTSPPHKPAVSNSTFTIDDLKKAFMAGSDKKNWTKIHLTGVISGQDYVLEPVFEKWFDDYGKTADKILGLFTVSDSFIPESEIKKAAKEDYDKQTKYDNAYDRQKGFVEGAKWVISRLKNYR